MTRYKHFSTVAISVKVSWATGSIVKITKLREVLNTPVQIRKFQCVSAHIAATEAQLVISSSLLCVIWAIYMQVLLCWWNRYLQRTHWNHSVHQLFVCMYACNNLRCHEWIFLTFNTETFYDNREVISILILIRTLIPTWHEVRMFLHAFHV